VKALAGGWSGGFSRSAVGITPHTQMARANC